MGKNTYSELLKMQQEKRDIEDICRNGILKNRKSIVVSTSLTENQAPGAVVVRSLTEGAFLCYKEQYYDTISFIGGKSIYDAALGFCDFVFHTHIMYSTPCTTYIDKEKLLANYELQMDLPFIVNPHVEARLKIFKTRK
jgi:dihydrofolate reductase